MNNMDGPFGGPPEWDVIVAEVNRLREENQRLQRSTRDWIEHCDRLVEERTVELRHRLAEAKREIEVLTCRTTPGRCTCGAHISETMT